jgi:UDPglucose 6-dehydrogenase
MKIGFMGLGKLGLPCALAIESKGHEVKGYDPDPVVADILTSRELPYREVGAQELLDRSNICLVSVNELARWAEIIFVPIQTPHDKRFEGITRLPAFSRDFEYSYLRAGVEELSHEIEGWGKDKIVIIISTVLPGTIRREIMPLLGSHTKLCYNPFFIAMGTTVGDFLDPEFVLFGSRDKEASYLAWYFYKSLHSKPFIEMSVESAELAKVAYNTFITSKIVIVNTLMEICHKIPGANVDDVTQALKLATDRVVSPKYMDAGMGDGGGCHPRDNIAMSWLAQQINLSHDIYHELMLARQRQTEWFAKLIEQAMEPYKNVKPVILGKSFKKETNLTVGSPAILLKNILLEDGIGADMFDPHIDGNDFSIDDKLPVTVYFIGTNHDEFAQLIFPEGATVLDPWGMIEDQEGVNVVRIGR